MTKILIVDDDHDFVSGVQVVLESAGYEVSSAHSIANGMKMFDSVNPDLIILDVMMDEPDDGFTMAQELKKKKAGTPVLMLSSVGKVTGLSFGQDDEMVPVDIFEEKPIMPNKLLEAVKTLLNR